MGLPLYNPPVESDIPPSKPISERRAAIARSRIRGSGANATANAGAGRPLSHQNALIRQRIRNLAQETRELRRAPSLRTLMPNATALVVDGAGEVDRPSNVSEVTTALWRLQQDACGPNIEDTADRDVPSDRPDEEPLRPIYLSPQQTRTSRVHAITAFAMQPFVARNPSVLGTHAELLLFHHDWLADQREAFNEDFRRGLANARAYSSDRSAFERAARRRRHLERLRREVHAEVEAEMGGPSSSSVPDGLGDRNRSLSPESHDVWDTLLYTVTPDPQPASAGSSFTSASASASARAAQDQSSAATSFTDSDPDAAAEVIWQELGCESENGDDADSDVDEDGMALVVVPAAPDAPVDSTTPTAGGGNGPRSPAGPHSSHWLIDRVLSMPDSGGQVLATLLQVLADRGEVSDSWLAEIGLSRTIPAQIRPAEASE